MNRAGILLCYPFEEQRFLKWNSTVLVQPKLDGERCRAIVDINPILYSSEVTRENERGYYHKESLANIPADFGTTIRNFALPSIIESLRLLYLRIGRNLELDGELYVHGWDFNDIHSIVSRSVNLSPEEHLMEFHVFDLITKNLAQIDRTRELMEIAKEFPPNIKLVKSIPAEDLPTIREIFNKYIENGYEGIIIRNMFAPYVRKRSPYIMKFKPKKSDIYEITGFVEGKGKYSETIGALICRGNDGTRFEVGSFSIPDWQRKELWNMRDRLGSFDCKVSYQHKWPTDIPKSCSFVELVEREKECKEINPLL